MPISIEVTITGRQASQRINRSVPEGDDTRIGRKPEAGWPIPWDMMISREHADLSCIDGQLRVRCLDDAPNPIMYRGQAKREITVNPGDWFLIGITAFQVGKLLDTSAAPPPTEETDADEEEDEQSDAGNEKAYSEEELKKVKFGNSERQLESLSRLPTMIANSHSDENLGGLLCRLLLDAVPQSQAVSVAHYDLTALPDDASRMSDFPAPLTMRVETREDFEGRFRPSRRMVLRALKSQQSVLHIWDDEEGGMEFTVSDGLGWAFCAPIRGESCQGWCMYVSGEGVESGGLIVSEEDLVGDLRYTELVAQFIGAIRQVRMLQEHKTQLSTFFSPKVIDSLTSAGASSHLEPAESNVSVLFCDVRGFSRKSEQLQDDLLALLKSVSAALGVMAESIIERDGAIADFQGDAVLGFWGWPVELEDGAVPACRAALAIYQAFLQAVDEKGGLLDGFSVGIGVAHGRALAGQVGTSKQAKVGVFGPVVNQGSRLEGMTKQFGVPICVDEATAEFVKEHFQPNEGRLRRLAYVRPKGMDTKVNVYGLLPPEEEMPEVPNTLLSDHEQAVEKVVEGKWDEARELLSKIPDDDGPRQFLEAQMARFDDQCPADWDGAFSLTSK